MRSTLPILALLPLLVPVLAVRASAEPATALAPATPVSIGDAVPGFSLPDLDGGTFDLATARLVTDEEAIEAARQVAAARADGADVTTETLLASLSGLQGQEGALDPAKVQALLQEAGRPYGLVANLETGQDFETVGDVAAWLVEKASAPIVFMCWSPKCSTSRAYEKRLLALLAETGARFYPLASNSKLETDDDARTFLAEEHLPYRVLLDREQRACDIFGGVVTPHVFLLDSQNRLVYSGSIDDDPKQKKTEDDDRQNWLRDAIEAVTMSQTPDVLVTTPKG